MGIVRELDKINEFVEKEEERRNSGGFKKSRWFGIKDKQAVKVLFLQELSSSSENYSQENGLGFLATEHSNPKDFKRKAVCTLDDEGQCYGCEMHKQANASGDPDYKGGWKARPRLYINVLVDDGINDPYVAVLSQGMGSNAITPSLLEQATEIGTITDKWMKIKRNGAKFNDTSYVLTPLGKHEVDVENLKESFPDVDDPETLELFDLDDVVRQPEYAKQEEHYNSGVEGDTSAPSERKVPVSASSIDAEW